MIRKFFTLAFIFFVANVCVAQLSDDFADGNFTLNPTWAGTSTDFIVNATNQLQLNNSIAATSYLTTPLAISDLNQVNAEWQVYARQSFSPSGSNYGRIYLTASNADLTQPLNGYYLQLGEAGSLDAIELFRQSGTTRVSVCRATNGAIAASFGVHIKVLRSSIGTWQLYADYSGGNTFILEASGTDATHSTSSYSGIECVYTVTNSTRFFFDDFLITSTPIPDTTLPTLQSTTIVDATTIDLVFSEPIDPVTANVISNYSINQGIGNPVSAVLQSDQLTVHLSFTNEFKNGYQHELSISGITDLAANEMTTIAHTFLYFVPTAVRAKDVIITEFFPDPSPVIGLPDQEFVEIYNRSNSPFDLANWKLTDRSSVASLPSQIILPQEYWIITSSSAVALFTPFGKTIGVSNFPTLNNSGDKIILLDPTGLKVDSLKYNLKWYDDADKAQGGWSLELLNSDTLRYDSANWLASLDARGGTPGQQNSQFGSRYDQTPPLWLNVTAINQNQLQLTFDERIRLSSVQNPNNYFVNNSIGTPTSISLSSDQKSISISFQQLFTNGKLDSITVKGLLDLSGNEIVPSKKSFLFFMASPIHEKDIVITEFMADPTPVIGLPEAEFIEFYNRSAYPIDMVDWVLTDGSAHAKFSSKIIYPNEYFIVSAFSVAQQFNSIGEVIGLTNFPSLNNISDKIILLDPTGARVDSLTYNSRWYNDADKRQGGWSIELLNPDVLRYDSANWLASLDVSGGTPGRQNSQFGNKFDQHPPTLINITVVNQKELQLTFNEEVERTLAESTSNYQTINQSRNPISATLTNDHKSISLIFQDSFVNGVRDSLTITSMLDVSENMATDLRESFLYFIAAPVQVKDIIINEFMADPSPVVGLPETEFIELYNRAQNPIDLTNWNLTDGSSFAKFPSKIILPNDYLIVASTSVAQQFLSFGNTMAVANFPSLNNSGDKILLLDPNGQRIDSLTYSQKWFTDSEKQQGGWSMELLNSDTVRYDSANWLASVDVSGGTPGRKNSQDGKFFDQTPPNLVSLTVVNQTQLQLVFNERLEQSFSLTLSNYTVSNQVGNPHTVLLSNDKKILTLTFLNDFRNGISHSITITGISDMAGNVIQSIDKDFMYFISQPVNPKDIVITEIMADPAPVVGLPEAEYIELFNRSTNAVNLFNWTITDGSSIAKFPSKIIQPNEYLIVHSSSSLQFNSYSNRIGLTSFPSLNNSSDSIVLKSASSITIDSVAYNTSWYGNSEKVDGGWALEIIDPQNICGEENNWTSSEDEKGGTPGKQNSVFANKPDLTGPKLQSVIASRPDQLLLKFDKKLEKQIFPSQFMISPNIPIDKTYFKNKALREVVLHLSTELSNRQLYTIKINDLRDCAGNLIQDEFNALSFALTEEADSLDVLTNEILFNPRPNGVDFIEIYNNSPKYINLKNWKLANSTNGILKNPTNISSDDIILSPFTHLALTEDVEVVKSNYPNNDKGIFLECKLPSFPDDDGSVGILNSEGKIIDQFIYSKNLHSPLIKDDEGVSLERISWQQPTQDISNWKSASSLAGFATPGYLNSNARPETLVDENSVVIEPEVFGPNSNLEFAKINFKFDQPNFSANVKIVDQQGRLIKTIANNETLPYEGFLRWDGDREDGSKARFGYYVVWFEVFDTSGFLKTFRKRVIVAGN